ncbi:hypothetical protein HH308_11845 [Gordonia sp. TBRC 11910]|uniref:Uncharacterized protein n=1 Tax=Gordonia asplenii TaxID=2725283 RepID=A0A848KUF3_9ACTN|nr:hypothetical protein [Gordonia asplenii]NMO01902.1 hypothetical protein [Gordonia asplenii]
MNGTLKIAQQDLATEHAHSWDAYIQLAPCAIARPKAEGFPPAALRASAAVARAPRRFADANLRRRCLV